MSETYASVADRLINAGFREAEAGCFKSKASPRVVGLAVCPGDPHIWRQIADDLLHKETMRVALSWTRYVILLLEGQKTSDLAWSAAAFAQDVSKCRRMVLFLEQNAARQVALPFVGLGEFGHLSIYRGHIWAGFVITSAESMKSPFLSQPDFLYQGFLEERISPDSS